LKIVTVRRISQLFFLLLFLWFCAVSTFGTEFWQIRGWPVNLFLNLDPLVALGTVLTTHTLYRGLLWALATVILTIIFGRFFCGWVCPFGTMHQFFGWLGNRRRNAADIISRNQYHKAQNVKYFILIAFVLMAFIPLNDSVSLQTGFLDPIPFVYRSVNISILPVADNIFHFSSVTPRQYEYAWVIGGLFLLFLFMNLLIPRFYCRFICPLGALLGILGRFSIWRIGKTKPSCSNCKLCDKVCEGACEPSGKIRIPECVLCFNCLPVCPDGVLHYGTGESKAGEMANPDITRRGFLASCAAGILALPIIRLGGKIGTNWYYRGIRPPGALPEKEFLERCIKCGQCMRICPTNIIVPGGLEGGVENLFTPVLNFRSGTSGCQLNCTACGFICPTAAIRPITISEKLGLNDFADKGPIRLGTAFVDRSRCLPWAMGTPCIVCQENCPVTPKAIYVKEFYETVREGIYRVKKIRGPFLQLEGPKMKPAKYATGDFFCLIYGKRYRITDNAEDTITLETAPEDGGDLNVSGEMEIQIRLQAPLVDAQRCIGCGTCEHECPVSGLRAIRVSAENETRNRERSLFIGKR
jgi:polyferredoxin